MYPVEKAEPTDESSKNGVPLGNISSTRLILVLIGSATLNPPMAEHLSFRIGNQIFIVGVMKRSYSDNQ